MKSCGSISSDYTYVNYLLQYTTSKWCF